MLALVSGQGCEKLNKYNHVGDGMLSQAATSDTMLRLQIR
jgi:hypothetical protein